MCSTLLELSDVSTARILLRGYGLQMARINASPVPAQVVKLKPLWDWSYMQLVGKSMGRNKFSTSSADLNPAVSSASAAQPQPAAGHRLHRNEFHQALKQCTFEVGHVTPFSRIAQAHRGVTSVTVGRSYFNSTCATVLRCSA